MAGCHETRAEAEAQSAALYANEPEATQEQEPGGPERCVCPECGHEAGKERGVPCRSMECSECGATMIAQTEDDDMGELTEAKTKDGHGRGDFLVVGDPEETSTWHLPVKTGGEPDRRLMGAAKAALTSEGGHRGNVYEGPDKAEALRKLKAMYDAEDMEWSESAVVQARNLIERALALLNETPGDNGHEPVAEDAAALSEAAIGRVIAIEEAETTAGLVPLTLDVALIEPGPGNAMDRHYYPAEVLRRDAGVFKGGKMYATDHRESAKDVGTWVSTIKACPVGFTESGAPIARVVVHKDWFARDIRALQAEGLLEKMECSIIGAGKAKKGTVNEQEYNIVEAITEGSADWVTRAGAGGRALALAESEPTNNGGEAVKEEKHEIEAEETEAVQEAETVTLREEETGEQPQEAPEEGNEVETTDEDETTEEPTAEPEDTEPAEAALPAERIDELLSESGLGEEAQRLLVRPYSDEQAVQDAIAEFKRILKKASGSGQPFAQGKTEPAQKTEITEADRLARYRRIKQQYGLDYELEG